MIPGVKARESLVELKMDIWIPLNAANICVCGLDHGVIRRGRRVVLSAYLDNGDDLDVGSSRRLRVCEKENKRNTHRDSRVRVISFVRA